MVSKFFSITTIALFVAATAAAPSHHSVSIPRNTLPSHISAETTPSKRLSSYLSHIALTERNIASGNVDADSLDTFHSFISSFASKAFSVRDQKSGVLHACASVRIESEMPRMSFCSRMAARNDVGERGPIKAVHADVSKLNAGVRQDDESDFIFVDLFDDDGTTLEDLENCMECFVFCCTNTGRGSPFCLSQFANQCT